MTCHLSLWLDGHTCAVSYQDAMVCVSLACGGAAKVRNAPELRGRINVNWSMSPYLSSHPLPST